MTSILFNPSSPKTSPRTIQRPTGLDPLFDKYFPYQIGIDDNGSVKTSFTAKDFSKCGAFFSDTVIRVSSSGNDSNNGSTWALAKASVSAAITAGNATSAPYTILIGPGLYDKTHGPNGTLITQDCAIYAQGSGVTFYAGASTTYTLDTNTTYTAAATTCGRVFDTVNLNQQGDYTELTKVASKAICEVTPGSWAYDGTANIYINRTDGAPVSDSNTRWYDTSADMVKCTANVNVYVENINFEGGAYGGLHFTGGSNSTNRVGVNRCSFKYPANSSGTAQSVTIDGIGAIAYEKCVFSLAQSDAAAITNNSHTIAFQATSDCIFYNNGIGSTSTALNCNGISIARSCCAISINDTISGSKGANILVSANAKLWAINPTVFNSLGDIVSGGVTPPCNFQSSVASDLNTPTIWIDGGVSSGSQYDAFVAAAGGHIFYRNIRLAAVYTPSTPPGVVAPYSQDLNIIDGVPTSNTKIPIPQNSFWAKQIPASTAINTDSANYITQLLANLTAAGNYSVVATSQWCAAVVVAKPDTPRVNIKYSGPYPGFKDTFETRCTGVPIPANMLVPSDSDGEAVFYDPVTDTLWELYQLTFDNGIWNGVNAGKITNYSTSDGRFSGAFGGPMASSLPLAAAQISAEDIQLGSINHVIGLELITPKSGVYWWPAQSTDGHGTHDFDIPEGARIRLDPTISDAALVAMNMTPIGLMIARCMQTYGAVVCDQGGDLIRCYHSNSYLMQGLVSPYPILSGGAHDSALLVNFPWSSLQVMPANYGE